LDDKLPNRSQSGRQSCNFLQLRPFDCNVVDHRSIKHATKRPLCQDATDGPIQNLSLSLRTFHTLFVHTDEAIRMFPNTRMSLVIDFGTHPLGCFGGPDIRSRWTREPKLHTLNINTNICCKTLCLLHYIRHSTTLKILGLSK
jgi:hypothetical protein